MDGENRGEKIWMEKKTKRQRKREEERLKEGLMKTRRRGDMMMGVGEWWFEKERRNSGIYGQGGGEKKLKNRKGKK